VGLRLARPGLHSNPAASLPHLLRTIFDVGLLDGFPALAEVGGLFRRWPIDRLLIPAVRAVGGSRVVFGRDIAPSVSQALAASCAIPVLFRPVWVAGDLYMDGGLHSPTNADVLIGESVDLAVILSPMTGSALGSRRRDGPLRAVARARLAREVRALESAGIQTLVFEPDAATVRAAGWNVLSRARVRAVVRASFLSALDSRSSTAERAELIDRLRTTRLSRRPA
jgi:NTE family protein